MAAMPATMRGSVLAALAAFFDQGSALELEHALFCFTCNNGTPYRREVFRLLHLGEKYQAQLRVFLERHSAVTLVAAPLASVLETPPEPVPHTQVYECEERLAAYCTRGTVALPDAGTQCARCRSRDIKFEMLQTRSADEPMSIFCTCERCGKRWRM